MKTMQMLAALSLAVTIALMAVDGASASSIVYAKGGDVWRSSPDGRHKVRLTTGGGYESPSQDDRGRVYAVRHGRFVRLTRGGRRIGSPFSAAVGRSGNVTAYGPWEAQVSPNGRRIAYWRGIQRVDAPMNGYTPYDLEDQVVVTRSDRFTADSVFGYQRDYRDPTWIGNRELLVFNYGLGVEEAAFFAPRPAGGPSFGQWFSDPDVAQIGDGELSRDGRLLVVGAGGGLDLNNIAIYRMSANTPPDAPQRVCTYHSKDGSTSYADPTFSPNGTALAFAQDAPGTRADGVYVWNLKGGCTGTARRIARRAIDPDWGPS
jgi:WD40 repeat protein